MTPVRKYIRKIVIGRAEVVHFLEFEIADVPAKVDTGAFRSSVHADEIKVKKDKNGNRVLSFRLLGGHPVFKGAAQTVTTKNFKKVRVTSSNGQEQQRYDVKLKIKVGPKVFWTNFSLTDRSAMLYPILLGRTSMSRRFIVDPALCAINRRELKKEYGIVLPEDDEDDEE